MSRVSSSGVQQSWWGDWGNLLLVALAAYAVAFIVWLIGDWGGEQLHTIVSEAGYVPVMLVGIIFAGRMALWRSLEPRFRRAWAVIAVAFTCWMVADGLWSYYEISQGAVPFPSPADAAYILAWLIIAAGILIFPAQQMGKSERTRYLLDSAIILISLTILVSYFIIGPQLTGYAAQWNAETVVLVSYPLVDVLVILAVASLLIRRSRPGTLGAIAVIGLGLLLYAAIDLLWLYREARGMESTTGIMYAAWTFAQTLVVAAPQVHRDAVTRGRIQSHPVAISDRLRTLTPYTAAALGALVVIVAAVPELIDRFGLIVMLLILLFVLFAARQATTIRENARLRIEQVKQESEERFRALVEYSSDAITVLDRDLICQFQSPSVLGLIQRSPEDFTGTPLLEWVHDADRFEVESTLQRVLDSGEDRLRFEWRLVNSDGHFVHMETIASSELNNPTVNGIVLNSRDVSERKQLEDDLTYQAYHDSLTNLPNRPSFLNSLMRALREAGPERQVGLIFLDLDRFKTINDTLGHDTGDELLVRLSERLQSCLRPDDILGRLGGDEFTVLLRSIGSEEEARRVAERILEQGQRPFEIAGTAVEISFSLGVACASSADRDPSVLLRHADSAMYEAKRNGRNRVEMFEPRMDTELQSIAR